MAFRSPAKPRRSPSSPVTRYPAVAASSIATVQPVDVAATGPHLIGVGAEHAERLTFNRGADREGSDEQLGEDVGLGGQVVVKRRGRRSQLASEIGDRGSGVALIDQEAAGDDEDLVARARGEQRWTSAR